MITKETCVLIFNCWNEIEKGKKLMSDMARSLATNKQKTEPTLSNAFGENCGLMLGVPSGSSGHSLYGVSTELGVRVIEEHIEKKKARLRELQAVAKIELAADNIEMIVNESIKSE